MNFWPLQYILTIIKRLLGRLSNYIPIDTLQSRSLTMANIEIGDKCFCSKKLLQTSDHR